VRQWVLALPYSLRGLVAARGEVLNAVAKVFIDEVLRWQRAKVQGGARGPEALRRGAPGTATFRR
jgi:ABC-type uncharacterized transport system YnjBCD ATPase subunit